LAGCSTGLRLLHQLVEASQYAQIPRYAGYVLATTVFGWATGGVIGGIVADYIGRKRTMMLAVLAYTLTTFRDRLELVYLFKPPTW
jgi:MFS family permease